MTRISLASALASGDLEPFIQQVEAEGLPAADRSQYDALLGAVTTPPQAGQTSRSPVRGSKRGK